ncbi:hypothetical protein LIER_02626 [Lithospermum erythrorhizon]|uniref:Uncharacterized protein n=1 Tax=Lithospermum erythrorhizon TaxID=34254 RepID=A0AAV3NQ43_LITER
MESIKEFSIEHVLRLLDKQADSLASLAFVLTVQEKEIQISVCQNWVVPPMFESREDAYELSSEDETLVVSFYEIDEEDWRQPFHPTVVSWPFDAWGIDMVDPLPKTS